MADNFSIEKTETDKSEITDQILRALPDWFGIESSIVDYVNDVKPMPFWKVTADNKTVGFLALNIHFPKSAEIHVMGIKKDYHRFGIGRALVNKAEIYLRQNNFEFLQVKTLSSTSSDKNYAKTREFYLSIGFEPLEEFKTLWDENNPCLLMIKKL